MFNIWEDIWVFKLAFSNENRPLLIGPPCGESFWQMLRRTLRRSCLVYSIFPCSVDASKHLECSEQQAKQHMH